MTTGDAGRGRGSEPPARSGGTEPMLEFSFGAAFTSIRTIPLQVPNGERLKIADLLPTASGRMWIVDAETRALQIYSQDGQRLGTLNRDTTGLRRPVSLSAVHVRWVAVLDGYTPRVAILTDAGRVVQRFPLPEVDRPVQICNLGDRMLAVVGSGWGPGSGKLVHLYNLAGEHLESFFGEPRGGTSPGRPFAASAGTSVYLFHSRSHSFSIYDVKARDILAFPCLAGRETGRLGRAVGGEGAGAGGGALVGLFATACGPLLAAYELRSPEIEYAYDLYALSGTTIAAGLHARDRVVGVEGPFFYAVRSAADGGAELRVWKMKFNGERLNQ